MEKQDHAYCPYSQTQLTELSFESDFASFCCAGKVNFNSTPTLVDVHFYNNFYSDVQPLCNPDGTDLVELT